MCYFKGTNHFIYQKKKRKKLLLLRKERIILNFTAFYILQTPVVFCLLYSVFHCSETWKKLSSPEILGNWVSLPWVFLCYHHWVLSTYNCSGSLKQDGSLVISLMWLLIRPQNTILWWYINFSANNSNFIFDFDLSH